ncbi:MAG TPA: S-methyl-5-thioribose-1-phosphate isomerase [Holophagaceae bacterium]|jgi:methylthioribose-1-phosphate isomerase|nr:S-methyl-5-thioribose-1-phosphate isomerase [Holophagaceae bacterium]
MKPFESLGLRFDGKTLWVLDQTRLPHEEVWADGSDPVHMVSLIRRLAVRGAPLMGVAAATSLACHAERGATPRQYETARLALRAARPTAVNLAWAVDRMRDAADPAAVAEAIFNEDVTLCERMANHGAALIGEGEAILTHCNTGGLATAGIGTALGVIRRAWEQGKVREVFVDETRPLLQGARLTAWELKRLGIPCTLLTDSMAAILLRDGRVQRVLVGADRVAANGDFANKVGTYGLAVLAAHHGVPFHPVAPYSTVDLACAIGAAIPIEQRDAEEVRRDWSPEVPVFNPAFDVTPVSLITSLVTDKGVLDRATLEADGLSELMR